MHRDGYWRSKIPVSLALLFFLNVFLILGTELLFFYKYPAQPGADALARYDALYSDCSIISSDSISGLSASLLETTDGQTHLVVTKNHGIAYGRGKIVYAELVAVSDTEQTVYVKNGIHTSAIEITGGDTVTIHYGYSGGIKSTTSWYMFLAAVLEGLELLVVHFIKRNLR